MLELLQSITIARASDSYAPLFRWTITDGLQRIDISLEPQAINAQPTDVLKHIRAVSKPGIYVLLDFHPFLEDPVHVRLLKDICMRAQEINRQIVLISHTVKIPQELESYCARFEMALPSENDRTMIVKKAAREYSQDNPGRACPGRSQGARTSDSEPRRTALGRHRETRAQRYLCRWRHHPQRSSRRHAGQI